MDSQIMLNVIFFIASLAVFIIIPATFLYSLFRPEKLYIHTRKNQNGKYSRTKFYLGMVCAWIIFLSIRTWAGNTSYVPESYDTNSSDEIDPMMSLEADDEELAPLLPVEQEQAEEPIYELSEYIDINEADIVDFMNGVWTVQVADSLSDEQKVAQMEVMYFGERQYEEDGFKQRDLAKSLLSKINPKIDEYKKKYQNGYRVKVPIKYIDFSELSFIDDYNESKEIFIQAGTFGLQQYDFEKGFFPLNACLKSGESQGFFMNWEEESKLTQGGGYPVWSDLAPREVTQQVYDPGYGEGSKVYMNVECGLSVDDEAQARKIEEVIVGDRLASKGFVYYNVPIEMGKSSVSFEPILADITYFDKGTNEILATKQFTW